MSPNIETVAVESAPSDQLPDIICVDAESELEDIIDELDYASIFGADQNLTTVERALASADFGLRACNICGFHLYALELTFDPIAGHGTVTSYIDGDHVTTEDITWDDIAQCRAE